MGENPQSALDLAACCGAVLGAAGERGVRCRLISPQGAKVALAGHGGADKTAMMAAVEHRFGCRLSKDRADAVGVALAALEKERQRRRLAG